MTNRNSACSPTVNTIMSRRNTFIFMVREDKRAKQF